MSSSSDLYLYSNDLTESWLVVLQSVDMFSLFLDEHNHKLHLFVEVLSFVRFDQEEMGCPTRRVRN